MSRLSLKVLAVDVIRARGHRLVKATHTSTLEITREEFLTDRGDCIIGIMADKAAFHLSENIKRALQKPGSRLLMLLYSNGRVDFLVAEGSTDLKLEDKRRIVVRKSSYIEPSTIGIRASKSAGDLSRELVESLKSENELLALLTVLAVE